MHGKKFNKIKYLVGTGYSFKEIFEKDNLGFRSFNDLQHYYYSQFGRKRSCCICGKRGTDVNNLHDTKETQKELEQITYFRKRFLCRKHLMEAESTKCSTLKGYEKLYNNKMLYLRIIERIWEDIGKKKKNKNDLVNTIFRSKHFVTICDNAGLNIEYVRKKAISLGLEDRIYT
jgi:hypothetical protein